MENYKFKRIEEDRNKFTYEVTVDYSEFQKYEDRAFKIEAANVKIPGFRPGQAPREMIEKEVATKIFSRAINLILPDFAEEVMVKEELSPISHLHYDLKELDKEHGVLFTFEVVTQPVIRPEDFKGIKVDEPKTEITEKEVEDVIKDMVRNNVSEDKIKFVERKEGDKDSDVKDFELTDELIKELKYEDSKTLDELKQNVRETLKTLKKQQSDTEYTNKVLDEAIKAANFHVPHEMIDDQVAGLEEDFKSRLKQIKLSLENYIQTQGTTIEEMRSHWAADAKARISSDLLLVNLAVKEGLVATEEEVEAEIEKMEDKQLRARYKNQSNKDYLRTIMTRERGLAKLIDIVKGVEVEKKEVKKDEK